MHRAAYLHDLALLCEGPVTDDLPQGDPNGLDCTGPGDAPVQLPPHAIAWPMPPAEQAHIEGFHIGEQRFRIERPTFGEP